MSIIISLFMDRREQVNCSPSLASEHKPSCLIMQNEQEVRITVRILSLRTYKLRASLTKPIHLFQLSIEELIHVPIAFQRLVFHGVLLNPLRCLNDYGVIDGSVIALIANRQQQCSNHTRDDYKRHRYFQQRSNGFRVRKNEILQVLQQSKRAIDGLLACINCQWEDNIPFKLNEVQRQIGSWIDVKDATGHWKQGQIIASKQNALCVRVGESDVYQWVQPERIMPFRSHTVQPEQAPYLSPTPLYTPSINYKTKTKLPIFVKELSNTMNNVVKLFQDIRFQQQQKQQQEECQEQVSVKNKLYQEQFQNKKNLSLNQLEDDKIQQTLNQKNCQIQQQHHSLQQKSQRQQPSSIKERQQFQTPSKREVGDNLSNKCQDDISNTGDKDDISNKSFKSKRSEGVTETTSMRKTRKPRQNKVFFDNTEEAQSVRSVKARKEGRNHFAETQQYILEVQDSFQQEPQEQIKGKKRQLQLKMKASQLAPLCDRLGRLLIDVAPLFAMLGHTDQTSKHNHENLSTCTNQGSLQSKMEQIKVRFQQDVSQLNLLSKDNKIQERSPSLDHIQLSSTSLKKKYCQFQIPLMLTPAQFYRINQISQEQKRQNIVREY